MCPINTVCLPAPLVTFVLGLILGGGSLILAAGVHDLRKRTPGRRSRN